MIVMLVMIVLYALIGQQLKLESTASQQLLTNDCNCRTKSVQILTPSQEKDESELWQTTDNQYFDKENSFNTKYCAKCDKLVIGPHFQYDVRNDYCCDCLDNNDINFDTSYQNNSQYRQQTNGSDNLSLYSIHMEKDFRYLFDIIIK